MRLLVFDFKKLKSRSLIDTLAKRASLVQWNEYKIAKNLASICINTQPFLLIHELLYHAMVKRRAEHRPTFFDMSRTRIGRQSLANRVRMINEKMKFDWCGL